MQAIILAAGMGKRLKELTQNNTKCMVEVNGTPLIKRCLSQLDELELSRIIIVLGYEADNLKQYVNTLKCKKSIVYLNNNIYDKTNNIYSLYLAKEYLKQEDTLLLESDIIFEDDVIKKILFDKHPNLALVDKYQSWMDGTCLQIDENNSILGVFDKKNFKFADASNYYKTVNIYKFSKEFSQNYYLPFLEAYIEALGNNQYYEQILKVIIMLENSNIKALPLNGELWYEIDDMQDLDIAKFLFANSSSEKLSKIYSSYGGYWRYPKLLDFCYLVNPYYPPKKMLEEIQASFTQLVINYPSGQRVNSLIAAKNFGLNENYIAVGNGAAELINTAMNVFKGKIGLIRPSFEEYANRCAKSDIVEFIALVYNANDLINYFNNKKIKTLVLVNPDNPSGNFIEIDGLLNILEWSKKQNINIIIDESFVDFAETQESATLLKRNLLDEYKNLVVIKSISKSYGVPGLRLGILASGNRKIIEEIKKGISIWNINSFAEFYLQICEKYTIDYNFALQKFFCERKRFVDELSKNKNLKIYPSQANYFMVELLNGFKARELCEKLLNEKQILIKDLSNKNGINGEFLRIAVKTERENNELTEAIFTILCQFVI